MFFVTGEIWKDLGWSGLEFALGLVAGARHRRFRLASPPAGIAGFSYAVAPFLAALNATPQVASAAAGAVDRHWPYVTGADRRAVSRDADRACNALGAVRTVDARLMRVAQSFSASDCFLFRSIVLPSAVPFLLAGGRLAIGRGMIGIVVGEIYGSAAGIGMMINQAGSRFETDRVFVGVLTIAVAGVALVEIGPADRATRRDLAPGGRHDRCVPNSKRRTSASVYLQPRAARLMSRSTA